MANIMTTIFVWLYKFFYIYQKFSDKQRKQYIYTHTNMKAGEFSNGSSKSNWFYM